MYYCLNPEYGFRGWNNLTYALVRIKNNYVVKCLSKEEYDLLNLICGRKTDDAIFSEKSISTKVFLFVINETVIYSETYKEPTNEQKYKLFECKYISEAVWAITGRCNYKCRHCSVSSPDYKRYDVSLDVCRKVIGEFSECGISNVTLIGGEPLIRKDFMEIVKLLNEYNIVLSQIFTNGSLIDDKLLNSLENYGIKPVFRMSFDGLGFHDMQRGVKNAERNLFQKIEYLSERNYEIVIDMCLNDRNISSLSDTVKALEKYKNIYMLNVTPTCDIGKWKSVNNKEKLSEKKFYEYLLDFISEYSNYSHSMILNIYRIVIFAPGKKAVLLPKNYNLMKYGSESLACPSFESTLNISPDGFVSPCYVISDSDYIRKNMPNIYKTSLSEILCESAYMNFSCITYNDVFKSNAECNECGYKNLCGGGCRANSVCETGKICDKDELSCAFFKNGYYDKFKQLLAIKNK